MFDLEPAKLSHPRPRRPSNVPYHHLLFEGIAGMPRGLLVLSAGFLGYLLATPLIAQLTLAIAWLLAGRPGTLLTYTADVATFSRPDSMLAAHLGLAALTVIVLLILRWLGGLTPAWATSVQPGMRWRYLALVLVPALVFLPVALLVTEGMPRFNPQHDWPWFLAVIVLTSPLQAAAEEYLFRGLFLQGFGAFARTPIIPIVLQALAFAAVHGVQNVPLFVDRFAFGLLAGLLVVLTGGLEAAIALHVANNLVAFIWALFFTSVADARTTTAVTWSACLRDVAVFVLMALLAWGTARLLKLETHTPAAVDDAGFED